MDSSAKDLSVPFLGDDGCETGQANKYYCDDGGGTTPFYKTCFNGINALSGVGILSVPYALASGGWLSLILLILIAAATCFTGLLMRRCLDLDSSIRTYPDIGERAFGNVGRSVISVFMYLELYLVATGFLILEGDNLQTIFPNMGFELAGIKFSGQQFLIVMVAAVILPTVLVNDMSLLSYVSASGVLASIVIILSIFWTGVFDDVGFHEEGKLLNVGGLPTAASLYAFCYCAHPVFPTLYTSMKDKSQFSKVLFVCFTICTVSYASMAVLGYMMYGDGVNSQITLNLPLKGISSKIAICTTLINPITKYALMLTPIVGALENKFLFSYKSKSRPLSILIRTSLLLSTVIVALSVPFFGDLMSLVGAFLSATASIIMPCVCYLKISKTYRRLGFELIIIVGIILMGVSVVFVGTFTSMKQIIRHI